jgi:DNA-binding NarL/FixJ family response regulator
MATEADVVLFDCFPGTTPGGALTGRLPERLSGPIVGYSWHTQPAHIDWALNHGFAGYLSKALSGSELVRALEAVREGETVIRVDAARLAPTSTALRGLTPREREVLTHVCAGMRNAEIAEQLNISPNSLKSYIRSAYRRIDVTTRSQAVLWGISHGLETR